MRRKDEIHFGAIAKGLMLTARHFFHNMKIHTAHLFGLKKNEKGMITYQYPEERRPFSPRAP